MLQELVRVTGPLQNFGDDEVGHKTCPIFPCAYCHVRERRPPATPASRGGPAG